MKIGDNIEIFVGTVIEDRDPKKLGRVKVGVKGYFDRETMSIDAIPWAYPFSMPGANSFSHMSLGMKVWLIDVLDNLNEYWYIPFPEIDANAKAAVGPDIDSDVVFSRTTSGSTVQIYQNKDEGIVIKNSGCTIKLNNNGAIIIEQGSDGGSAVVKLEGGVVSVGSGDEWEPMVRGNKLYDILSQLSQDLNALSQAASPVFTSGLVAPFKLASQNINTKLNNLLSTHSKVSS